MKILLGILTPLHGVQGTTRSARDNVARLLLEYCSCHANGQCINDYSTHIHSHIESYLY